MSCEMPFEMSLQIFLKISFKIYHVKSNLKYHLKWHSKCHLKCHLDHYYLFKIFSFEMSLEFHKHHIKLKSHKLSLLINAFEMSIEMSLQYHFKCEMTFKIT